MAEGFFRDAVRRMGMEDRLSVESAGVSAFDGDTASSYSINVLAEGWGIDLSAHRSRGINENLMRKADLVLTMTRSHKGAVVSMFPQYGSKVYTLKEYVMGPAADKRFEEYNYNLDITDPYGMPVHVYRRCAEEIKEAVDKLVQKLNSL